MASAAVMMPVAATALHALGLSTDPDMGKLASGLFESSLWLTLGAAALFGGLGGIVAELISLHGRIELPHRVNYPRFRKSRLVDPHHEFDLGILSRVVLGATAGVALLAVYAPPTAGMLVVNALIAGSAATAIFRLCQMRLLGNAQQSAPKQQPKTINARLAVVGRTDAASASQLTANS